MWCRLHARYRELAPHLVPLDYTNNPDIKVPMTLIITMPELKVQFVQEPCRDKILLAVQDFKTNVSHIPVFVGCYVQMCDVLCLC